MQLVVANVSPLAILNPSSKQTLTKERQTMETTYTLDYGTSTASDLAWWIAYGLKRVAIAQGKLNHEEITQGQFDNVVATYTKQAAEFAEAGYVA